MKRVLAVFGIFVLAVLLFAPAAFAEETPALTARSAPGDNGDISVTFSLGSLPEGTGISYAQIELSLQPGDFSLREDSFSWLPKDAGVLVSPQWNSGRLLLLLEPQNAAFAGLDAQPLFSLRLQNRPGFPGHVHFNRSGGQRNPVYRALRDVRSKPAGFFRRGLLPFRERAPSGFPGPILSCGRHGRGGRSLPSK